MSDYAEWKRLAEAAPDGWLAPAAYEEDRRYSDEEIRFLDFLQVVTPAAVLAMIAENEALRKSMREIMNQVDGNIRETVRDCVNGHNDVQDIYGYCDSIEKIIDTAMSKEP